MSGLYRFFPTPSDRMGTLWALSSIRDAVIIEYGPGGTTHYSMEGIFKINGDIRASAYTTHIDEADVVMGDSSRLEQAVLEVDAVYSPAYIFIIASSLASVIGADVEGIVRSLADRVKAKLIVYTSGGFQGDYTKGVSRVLSDLATHVVQPTEAIIPASYNLIGCCVDDYRYASNVRAIRQTLSDALGMRCQCVFTSDTSITEIENASSAAMNIVLRHEGVACAEILKTRFGAEYVYGVPVGYQATLEWTEQIAKQIGRKPDAEYLAEKKQRGRELSMRIKMRLRKAANRNAVLSGGYDAVRAFERFLRDEIGLTVCAALIHHGNFDGNAPSHYIWNAKEHEKENAIDAHAPAFVFGDAVLLRFAKPGTFIAQIQNPNLDEVIVTAHKPTYGFEGADEWIERLLTANSGGM